MPVQKVLFEASSKLMAALPLERDVIKFVIPKLDTMSQNSQEKLRLSLAAPAASGLLLQAICR